MVRGMPLLHASSPPVAKKRLRMILVADRMNLTPASMVRGMPLLHASSPPVGRNKLPAPQLPLSLTHDVPTIHSRLMAGG